MPASSARPSAPAPSRSRRSATLELLLARAPVEAPVALVAAHPDDETIGAAIAMGLFRNLRLIHVTDGAPRNLADAHAHGFPDAAAYAAARAGELGAALAAGGVRASRAMLGVADQGATDALAEITRALSALLGGMAAVVTHPYEGGHPDHDATACAVHRAARCPVYEFASYHAGPGGLCTGAFLPGPDPVTLVLTPEEAARKRAMLDCFATQRATLAPFGTAHEPFRPAPHYDFTRAPHPGTLHYERYEWGMTGARFREAAAAC